MNKARTALLGVTAGLALLVAVGAVAAPGVPVDPATVVAAKTRADHETIAKAYEEEAARLDEQSRLHGQLAKVYGSHTAPKYYSTAMQEHCRGLEKEYKASAELNRKLAAVHRRLAADAGQ